MSRLPTINDNAPKFTDDGWIDMKILRKFVYEKEKENPNIINILVKDIMTMPEFLEYVKQRQSSDDLNNRPNDKE